MFIHVKVVRLTLAELGIAEWHKIILLCDETWVFLYRITYLK